MIDGQWSPGRRRRLGVGSGGDGMTGRVMAGGWGYGGGVVSEYPPQFRASTAPTIRPPLTINPKESPA